VQLLFAVAVAHHGPHEHGGVSEKANVTGTVAHGHISGLAVVSHAAKLDGAGGNVKAAGVHLLRMLLSVGRGGEIKAFENSNMDPIDDCSGWGCVDACHLAQHRKGSGHRHFESDLTSSRVAQPYCYVPEAV
jgi:hypothetical protein